jgi:hypothetical protein
MREPDGTGVADSMSETGQQRLPPSGIIESGIHPPGW